jgi:uncharacterized NAD(P)/FAD-binding protein YdhS
MGALTTRKEPLRLAIIGGGFTGVAVATHALTSDARPLSIDVIEPAAKLGRGAAYGTMDRDHRINVPSDRMSLFSADPAHFTRWLFDNKWLPDVESVDPLGRCYPSRSAFAAYIEHVLTETGRRCATRASLRHYQTRAQALAREDRRFRVELEDGTSLQADRVAICTGHAPGAPCRIRQDAARRPRLIANPWRSGSLAAVNRSDSVLIVGTGLTMVDVAATLARRDHRGPIVAVSPRGFLPRDHGRFVDSLDLFEGARPRTALELLRLLRVTVRQRDGELDWQSIIDALRRRLHQIWPSLPPRERLRVVRRLLPFWEVHRFRAAPQGAAAVARLRAQGTLTVERARVIELDEQRGSLVARLMLPGGQTVERAFDAVIICSGASPNLRDNPLLDSLVDQGLAQADDLNFGVKVDKFSRLIDARGTVQTDLFAFGPITRGTFGEMTGAPDILRQIERVIPILTEMETPIQSVGLSAVAV